jgi:mgtE-like transporter
LTTISVVGGVLGSLLILLVTLSISILSHRRGWDLDSVATPMVTALGDMATIPTLFLATYLVRVPVVNALACATCVLVAVFAGVRASMVDDAIVRRIVRQMTGVILLTPLLDIVAGAIQEHRIEALLMSPAVLIMIPPFVSQAGALGGIFASRISSKLQIGVIGPRGLPEGPAAVDAALVATMAIGIFALIGGAALGVSAAIGDPAHGPLRFLVATILAGIAVTPLLLVAAYVLAVVTFRFGLDPDDQTVPIITSLMDLVGVVILLSVMTHLGILPLSA